MPRRGCIVPSPVSLCGKILLTPKLTSGSEEREALLQENHPCSGGDGAMQTHIPPEPACASHPRPNISSPFSSLAAQKGPSLPRA